MLPQLIFVDFECEAFSELHAASTKKCTNGLSSTALAADHFAEIFCVYAKFEDNTLGSLDDSNVHILGVVH